jgi:dienelactone hydrolase
LFLNKFRLSSFDYRDTVGTEVRGAQALVMTRSRDDAGLGRTGANLLRLGGRWIHAARQLRGIASTHALIGSIAAWLFTMAGAGVVAASGTNVHIPSSAPDVVLAGRLHRPSAQGPSPAVILMHGCGGWQPAVLRGLKDHAAFFVRNGFVVLNLDSFGPRGNAGGTVCTSYSQLAQARKYRTRDAFDALDFLRRQTFVDPENIFLIGQSNGGSVAMLAATEANQPSFRGAVALYPWCGATGSRRLELAAPLLILGGARDDWVPPRDCQHLAANGAELRVKVYRNAAHSFDIPIPVQRYLGKRIGFNRSAAEDSRKEMVRFFRRHVTDRQGTAALR